MIMSKSVSLGLNLLLLIVSAGNIYVNNSLVGYFSLGWAIASILFHLTTKAVQ